MIATRSKDSLSLREANHAFTRRRFCSAANILFYERGFAQTTMDEIATTAGARRSTLYLYFKTKDEILAAIAEDYAVKISAIMDDVPGPQPSNEEITAWLLDVAALVARERTPTILLIHLGSVAYIPPAVESVGKAILDALAKRLPAFRRALEPGVGQSLAVARAGVVLREMCLACLQHARDPGSDVSLNMIIVAVELFERFLHDGN